MNSGPDARRASIVIADADTRFSAALGEVLREDGHRCTAVTDGNALLKQVEDLGPDFAVVDGALFQSSPEPSVLELLRRRSNPPKVVVVTAKPSLDSAIAAVNMGVAAYLLKPIDPAGVVEVLDGLWQQRRVGAVSLLGPLNSAAELERGFDRALTALGELREASGRLLEATPRVRLDSYPGIESLSPREREVLEHIVSGHRVPTIARDLFISPHTVRNHLKSIFQKIGVGSQVELVEWLQRRS